MFINTSSSILPSHQGLLITAVAGQLLINTTAGHLLLQIILWSVLLLLVNTAHCSLIIILYCCSHSFMVSSIKPVNVCCCISGQFAMAGEDLIWDCLCASMLYTDFILVSSHQAFLLLLHWFTDLFINSCHEPVKSVAQGSYHTSDFAIKIMPMIKTNIYALLKPIHHRSVMSSKICLCQCTAHIHRTSRISSYQYFKNLFMSKTSRICSDILILANIDILPR